MEVVVIIIVIYVIVMAIIGTSVAAQKQREKDARIELMKNHPEAYDRLVADEQRKSERNKEIGEKVVKVAAPVVLALAQKILKK